MQNRDLKLLIIATALIPSLLIAIGLGTYLGNARARDIDRLLQERGNAAAQQLAVAMRTPLERADTAALQELTTLALEERGVRAAALFAADGHALVQAGPRLRTFAATELAATLTVQPLDENVRFVQPVYPAGHFTASFDSAPTTASDNRPLGWIALEYSRHPYELQRYQSLLVAGLLTLLAVITATAIAVYTSRRLLRDVDALHDGVERIRSGRFDMPIRLSSGSELAPLAGDLNDLAGKVANDFVELQRNLEQSNRDLRESLETVEIQNIELDLARREALEASRIKSEFLANTSHELRTPLNGIIGFTKLLLKSGLDARARDYLETIRYSAENLLTIINDILDFSKIEAGKLVLDNVPMNLRDVIEETLAILAPSAHEKGLDLVLLYDGAVPPALIGDPLRLRQILTNLISNGIKFTNSGQVVVRVSLTGDSGARVPLRISVADTGIGLTESQQRQLFKAFAQADASTSRLFGGTGLGLAISKRLVEQMGGEISLESQSGQGSTFWISLRLQRQANPLTARGFDQLFGRQLLLFDSSPLSQLALRQLLESWGATVTACDDWSKLLRQLRDGGASCLDNGHGLDGCVISLNHAELDSDQLAALPAPPLPAWLLLPGLASSRATAPGYHLLAKPIAHLQLYDQLCDTLATRTMQIAESAPPRYGAAPPVSSQADPHSAQAESSGHDSSSHGLPHPDSADATPHHGPPQVLAVDDNPTNLKLLGVLLDELGAQPHLASGGRQALGLCDQQRFDLILMDIQMPELNGLQVTQLIRGGGNRNRDSRIVALTAHLLPEEQRQLLAAGFDLCLTKPITERQLQQLLIRDAPLPQSTTAAVQWSERPVDLALCLQRAQRKPDLARELLDSLLDSLQPLATQLAAQLEQRDYPALLDTTHKLHGICCYSGVPRLQQRSSDLEGLLKQLPEEKTEVDSSVQAMLAAIDELITWQREHDLDVLFETSAV